MEREFLLWLSNLSDHAARLLGRGLLYFQESRLGAVQNALLKSIDAAWTSADLEIARNLLGIQAKQDTAGEVTLYSAMKPEDFIDKGKSSEPSSAVVLSDDVNGRSIPALYNPWFERYKLATSAVVITAVIGVIAAAIYYYREELGDFYKEILSKYPGLTKLLPDFILPDEFAGGKGSDAAQRDSNRRDAMHATKKDYDATSAFAQKCVDEGVKFEYLVKLDMLLRDMPRESISKVLAETEKMNAFKNQINALRAKQSGVSIRFG